MRTQITNEQLALNGQLSPRSLGPGPTMSETATRTMHETAKRTVKETAKITMNETATKT